MDKLWGSYGPSVISATRADEPNALDSVRADAARQFYAGGEPFSPAVKQELVDMLGDAFLISPTHKAARIQSK